MTARFAAHNPPDVFYVDSSVDRHVGATRVSPAAERLSSSETQFNTKPFYPKLLSAFKKGKHDLRLPEGLVAARDGDQQRAVRPRPASRAPKTWAQLKSDAKTMVNEGRRQAPDLPLAPTGRGWAAFMYQNRRLAHEAPHVDGERHGGQLLRRPAQVAVSPTRRRPAAGAARRSARATPRSSSRATGCSRT